jgi:hypothetical protein
MASEKKKRFLLTWTEFARTPIRTTAGHQCSQRIYIGSDDKFYVLTRILDIEGKPFIINIELDNALITTNVEDRIDEMEMGMIGAFGHDLKWSQVERLAINVMQGAIDCAFQITKDYGRLGIYLPWPNSGEHPAGDPFEEEK